MPGIAAVAMLEDLHMRDRTDTRQLRDLGGDIADHQRGVGAVEPVGDHRHSMADAGPAERRAVQRLGRRHHVHRSRLQPGRLEERGDGDDLDLRRQGWENVVARTEDGDGALGRQGVQDRGAAFGMAAPLMVDEIT